MPSRSFKSIGEALDAAAVLKKAADELPEFQLQFNYGALKFRSYMPGHLQALIVENINAFSAQIISEAQCMAGERETLLRRELVEALRETATPPKPTKGRK